MLESIKVFYCYSRKDQTLREKLDQHLAPLKFAKIISTWYDLLLEPGNDWQRDIGKHLDTADIVLLLVSDNFLSSPYCFSIELKRALEREERQEACVIPIILKPCDWRHKLVPFSKLTALPNHEEAITEWKNQDTAFATVARSIRLKVETLIQQRRQQQIDLQTPDNWVEKRELHPEKEIKRTSTQIDVSSLPQKELQDCDPSTILFMKNVKDPKG